MKVELLGVVLAAGCAVQAFGQGASPTPAAAATGGSGYNKNAFTIGDGSANSLSLGGTMQFRYIGNLRDEDSAGSQNDFTQGFQMARTRLRAKGSIWDKNLTYQIQGDFARNSGEFTLLDAFAQYTFENKAWIKWGQYKLPLLREEVVSHMYQLAVNRSTTNAVFTGTRVQGVQVGWEGEDVRITGDLTDGLNTLNTDFTAAAEADLAGTARAEWKFAGDGWAWAKDFTSFRGSPFAGMVGAAIHGQTGGETGFTTDRDLIEATVDVSLEGDGWNAFGALIWRNTDAGGSETDDFGAVVQGGVFLSDDAELFARWDALFPDDSNGDDFHTVTGGVNYYVAPQSHAFKLTADVQYLLDNPADTAIFSANTSLGTLTDTEEGQWVIRLQAQLVF